MKRWNLIRNVERYKDDLIHQERWPNLIIVYGTRYQANFVAKILSGMEAGCDYYWYIDEEEVEK